MIIPVVSEQLVEEKIDLDTKALFWNAPFTANAIRTFTEYAPFKINRNLCDDTFNLELHPTVAVSSSTRIVEIPYINVNNEYEIQGWDSSLNRPSDDIMYQSYSWVAHHSLFKDLKFHNTSVIALGTDIHNDSYTNNNLFFRNIIYPHFSHVKNKINASYKDVIHFKTIKSISGKQKEHRHIAQFSQGLSRMERNGELITNLSYNDIYIRPLEPNIGSTDKRIAEIYIHNSDNTPYKYDYNITNGLLQTSSLPNNKLETYFESSNENKTYNGASFIGYISVADPTYYDYDKHQTKVGYSSTSKEGDTVPYNYKGDFTRSITLGINGVFNKITISFSKKIDAPLLDPYEGKVRLFLTYSEQPLSEIPRRFLDGESIKKIRDHYYTLQGINRLSKVYEI